MSTSFTTQVEQLAQRQYQRKLATATCWTLVSEMVWFALLVVCDRLLTPESLGSRLVLSALGLAGAILIAARWWRQASQQRDSPLALALQMESRYPQLRDVATSALDFSAQDPDDPRAGSESLRRAVVLQANSLAASIDWQQLLPALPLRLATRFLAAVSIAFLLIAWWSPQTLSTGWLRLSQPFGSTHWPRENNLEFVEPPDRLLAGSTLELTLKDSSGPLPEDAEVQLRQWRDGMWHERTLTLSRSNQTAEASLANVQQSLEYRATGGDHRSMPWRKLDVVTPPHVRSLQAVVHPPAYSEIEPFDWQPGLQLLKGSQVTVNATFDRPVRSASLVHQGGRQFLGELVSSENSVRFLLEDLAVQDAGTYFVEFTSDDQLSARSAKTLSLDIIADERPIVRFAEPAEHRLAVTPSASVSIELEARDDLALSEVGAVIQTDASEALRDLTMWQGSRNDAMTSAHASSVLEVAEFNLPPGTRLSVIGWARDFRPQSGQTTQPLRLRIVSEEELLQQLSDIEKRIQAKLRQSLSSQIALHARVSEQAKTSDFQDEQFRTQIHLVLFGQRSIAGSLHAESGSVSQLAEEILLTIDRNHLPLADTERTVREVRSAVITLAANALPAIEESLTAAARNWEIDQQPDTSEIKQCLAECIGVQQHVIDTLNELVRDVSENTDVTQMAEELSQIGDQQQELAAESERELRQWLSKPKQDTGANSKHAANLQKQLARQLANLTERMQTLSDKLAQRQPQLSQRLQQACSACQNTGVANTMYSAAQQLSEGRLSKSNQLQRQAEREIRKLNDLLSDQGKPKPDSQTTVKQSPAGKNSRPSKKPGSKPRESIEKSRGELVDVASREEVAALVDALWGHLPERQRQQILQPLGDDFLPEYAEDIKAYFRALAKPDEKQGESP